MRAANLPGIGGVLEVRVENVEELHASHFSVALTARCTVLTRSKGLTLREQPAATLFVPTVDVGQPLRAASAVFGAGDVAMGEGVAILLIDAPGISPIFLAKDRVLAGDGVGIAPAIHGAPLLVGAPAIADGTGSGIEVVLVARLIFCAKRDDLAEPVPFAVGDIESIMKSWVGHFVNDTMIRGPRVNRGSFRCGGIRHDASPP